MKLSEEHLDLSNELERSRSAWIPLREAVKQTRSIGSDELEQWSSVQSCMLHAGSEQRIMREKYGEYSHHSHRSIVSEGRYYPSDLFNHNDDSVGINLVIEQAADAHCSVYWHLHPDLVIALGLRREGNIWFRPEEGWAEVIKLLVAEDGVPLRVEIKAEFLKDYLSARNASLFLQTYQERDVTLASDPGFREQGTKYWEAGEARFENVSEEHPSQNEKWWLRSALWRNELFKPSSHSPRVRGDEENVDFAIGSQGERKRAADFQDLYSPPLAAKRAFDEMYLVFEPTLALELQQHRDSVITFVGPETGYLGATRTAVHFGITGNGKISILAKDIGKLLFWEQRKWAGFNITWDGSIPGELIQAQLCCEPPADAAPEQRLEQAISDLEEAFGKLSDGNLLRENSQVADLLKKSHRFKAADSDGLPVLAKTLTKLFIERLNLSAIKSYLSDDFKGKELKGLQAVIAQRTSDSDLAKATMSPLFGMYDLRGADAHLGSSFLESGLKRMSIDVSANEVEQGRQILNSFVVCLEKIAELLARKTPS